MAKRNHDFNPGLIALFTNPFYFARKGLHDNICALSSRIIGRTLDAGCGSKPYQNLFESNEYIGREYDTPSNRANKIAGRGGPGILNSAISN